MTYVEKNDVVFEKINLAASLLSRKRNSISGCKIERENVPGHALVPLWETDGNTAPVTAAADTTYSPHACDRGDMFFVAFYLSCQAFFALFILLQ